MRISPKIFRVVGAVAYLVTAQTGLSASTFVGLADDTDDSGFNSIYSEYAYLPFAATMNYRWEVVTPGDTFSVNTLSGDWYIMPDLKISEWVYWPDNGMKVRDLIISLENETGNLEFVRTETIDAAWPGGNGIFREIPITGAGTFTAITFTVNFDDVPADFIARLVNCINETTFLSGSSLNIQGTSGEVTVVPEPSSGALMGLGIGVVIALRRCRRSVV